MQTEYQVQQINNLCRIMKPGNGLYDSQFSLLQIRSQLFFFDINRHFCSEGYTNSMPLMGIILPTLVENVLLKDTKFHSNLPTYIYLANLTDLCLKIMSHQSHLKIFTSKTFIEIMLKV